MLIYFFLQETSKKLPIKRAKTSAKAPSKKRKKDDKKGSDVDDAIAIKRKNPKKSKKDVEFVSSNC